MMIRQTTLAAAFALAAIGPAQAEAPPGPSHRPRRRVQCASPLLKPSRLSGIGQPVNWVVVDILRIENGLIAEHWDVIQDEATRESSKSGRPMFGELAGDSVRVAALAA
jgi:hypothetical protein